MLKQEVSGLFASLRAVRPGTQCLSIAYYPADKARWKRDPKEVSKGLLKYYCV